LLRILMTPENCGSDCDATCQYGAWSPTLVDPPSFHRSEYFGYATLRYFAFLSFIFWP
jgi:hypothetical protein